MNLLIVDDNERIFESLEINFRQIGFNCLWAMNSDEAMRAARKLPIAAAIIDLSLAGEDGIDVMQKLFDIQNDMPAIVITGFGSVPAAVRAIKLGAYDFLAKPLNFERLNEILQEALRLAGRSGDGARGQEMPTGRASQLVTRSPDMEKLWAKAAQIASTDIPVLITGESGTGKELFTERIHEHSERKAKPFIRVNCSSFTETLADSELFGHRKGAFTGASDNRSGIFRQADGGTLHLDEIGDMPLSIQAKLLRVLEDSRIRPIGGEKELAVDVRIVASTNKDLGDMVEDGAFRRDLYYRLNAVQLHIPPLRERADDIPPLLEHFLRRFARDGMKRFSDKAVRLLGHYYWPGNVRELRNIVKVCAAITPGSIIELDDLPAAVTASGQPRPPLSGRITDAERDLIIKALEDAKGNRQAASYRLGISRRTLYNKMKNYGLDS